MKEYIVYYYGLGDDFERSKTYQAHFANEAIEEFLGEHILVKEFRIEEYITDYEIIVKYEDEPVCTYHYEDFRDLMNKACYMEAFSDCAPAMEIFEVRVDGELISYCGWRPGMRMTWIDEEDAVVWDECYPNWDH